MTGWNSFPLFAASAFLFWIAGAWVSVKSKKTFPALLVMAAGTLVFLSFLIGLWISLERPPLRTQGETRLWYSLFLILVGSFVYARWRYRWILPFSAMTATVFLCVNLFKPQIHDKVLMPALQSVWFVPHVTVYMFAYGLMGAAALFALFLLLRARRKGIGREEMQRCDSLVRIGWGFLTMGIVMGAIWAKQAWGDYWAWDPKETWAAATWMSYLLYLHVRPRIRDQRYALALLLFSFLLLQMCWWGVNYLPSAQGASLHTY